MTLEEAISEMFLDDIGDRLCADQHRGDNKCHGCTAHMAQRELADRLVPGLAKKIERSWTAVNRAGYDMAYASLKMREELKTLPADMKHAALAAFVKGDET